MKQKDRSTHKLCRRPRRPRFGIGCTLALGLQLAFATGPGSSTMPLDLKLVTETEHSLPQRTDLELQGSRTLEPGESLLLEIGKVDVSDLFRHRGSSLTFRSDLLPLPAGENELVISLKGPSGAPVEILRQTLRVRTRHGLDTFELLPSVDLESVSQIDSGSSPEEDSGKSKYEEVTGQLRLEANLERFGWRLSSEISLLGVSEVENALRFSDKGDDADLLDLSSYLLRAEKGRSFVELGHISYGDQRHLIDGFASRGLGLGVPVGSGAAFSLLLGSGSQIVGFDDLSGLQRGDHQVFAATFEVSLLPKAREALRFQLSYLDGSLLPISDFNQGLVNDAERSHGFAAKVSGEMGDRGHFEAGFTRSTFDNPADPFLDQGDVVVATEEEERDAYYADLDFVLFRHSPAEGWNQELTLSLNHEHVEPLFRSTAASATADFEESRATLNGISGPISYIASQSRSKDNLDEIPSILTTKTRANSVSLVLPISQIWHEAAKPALLPTVTFSTDRTRQFGVDVPENGGFSASHVPDQVSVSQIAGLEWQGNRWRFAYELSFSDQDNRQTGREDNDFEQLNHSLRLDLGLTSNLDLGLEFSRERAESIAEETVTTTERPALNISWQATDRLLWGGSYSLTESESSFASSKGRGGSVEGSYRLSFREERQHGLEGQIFLRFDSQSFTENDSLFGFMIDRKDWALQAGLNLSIH